MLKACYQINSRPDALVKEQLVEMTRLSQRVIRVWFQNKVTFKSKSILLKKLNFLHYFIQRCKDKKKVIAAKLQMQQEKVKKILNKNEIIF